MAICFTFYRPMQSSVADISHCTHGPSSAVYTWTSTPSSTVIGKHQPQVRLVVWLCGSGTPQSKDLTGLCVSDILIYGAGRTRYHLRLGRKVDEQTAR